MPGAAPADSGWVSTLPETSALAVPRSARRRRWLAYGSMARRWFLVCLAVDLALTAVVVFVVGFGTYYQWRQEHPWLLVVTIGVTSLILFRSTWRGGAGETVGAEAAPPGRQRVLRRR